MHALSLNDSIPHFNPDRLLDANKQADAALSVLNLKPLEIIGIQINGASMPPRRQPMIVDSLNSQNLAQGDATTPIVAGEQQVQAFVTLQIRY